VSKSGGPLHWDVELSPTPLAELETVREQRGPLWGTQRSGVMSPAGARAWTAQLDTGAFQGERCQPFYMIPLERWNVERKVTSAVKVQREKAPALVYALL
jgi:hypothetical protein